MTRFHAVTFWLAILVGGCTTDDNDVESHNASVNTKNAASNLTAADPKQRDDATGMSNRTPVTTPDRQETRDSAEPANPKYDGLTLVQWQQRIKDLDPNDPASAAAVRGLIEIVSDTDAPWYSRRQAALTLGRIGPLAKRAVPLLIDLLDEKGDIENMTPLWAAASLALFGPEASAAAPALVERLHDKSGREADRVAALGALSQIGTTHSGVVPAVIRVVSSSTESDNLRGLAAETLATIGPGGSAAIPALMRATGSKNELLRRKSVTALGAMGTLADVAVPTLTVLLVFDESAAVRDQAAAALAQIGSKSVSLLTHLLVDEDAEVRWRAATSLGKIRPLAVSAAGPLKKALRDESAVVRICASESLWTIDNNNADQFIPTLLEELTNEDRQIRIRAYRLLISLGDKARPSIEPLKTLLSDDRPFVRQLARKTLDNLTGANSPK